MTYRNIEYLSYCPEVRDLTMKYQLKLKVVDNKKIFLISNCFIIEIYGFVIEDIFYFDIFSKDLDFSSTLNRILSDCDYDKMRLIYESQIAMRKNILTKQLQGNLEITLKAEQYFFTKIQTMDELLGDIISCKKEISNQYFSPIFEYKKKELEAFCKF